MAPGFLSDCNLTDEKGFIPVDLHTNQTTIENVFCIGDACSVTLPNTTSPHPKAGAFAAQMGVAVADIIDARLRDREEPLPSTRSATCYAECGDGAGIAVNPNLDRCMTGDGPPSFNVHGPSPDKSIEKTAWVNSYVSMFFSDDVPQFTPRTMAARLSTVAKGVPHSDMLESFKSRYSEECDERESGTS